MSRSKGSKPDPAAAHLAAADPAWATLIARVGPCTLQLKPEREPYEALVRAIAYQQIHGRAAEAILGRFLALYGGDAAAGDTSCEADAEPGGRRFPVPEQVLGTDPDVLRGCGFSGSKVATIIGIADGARSGLVPTAAEAVTLSDEALIERLTTLRGVGRWTVEMLLMFTLGRPDVLPVGDFGVREGWRLLKGLDEQPKPKALAELGLAWSPYRSTAAWYLWRAADLGRQGWSATNPA